MRAIILFAAVLLGAQASAGSGRRSLEPDECGRRSLQCEQLCDGLDGMARLSCKTDCRMAESQCRNKPRR